MKILDWISIEDKLPNFNDHLLLVKMLDGSIHTAWKPFVKKEGWCIGVDNNCDECNGITEIRIIGLCDPDFERIKKSKLVTHWVSLIVSE